MKNKKESEVAQSFPTLCDPMNCSLPGSSIRGIFQYWSGLPFPSPEDLPDPGNEPGSPSLKADALPSEPPNFRMIVKFPYQPWMPTLYLKEREIHFYFI